MQVYIFAAITVVCFVLGGEIGFRRGALLAGAVAGLIGPFAAVAFTVVGAYEIAGWALLVGIPLGIIIAANVGPFRERGERR